MNPVLFLSGATIACFLATLPAQSPQSKPGDPPTLLADAGEATQLVLQYGTFDPLLGRPAVPELLAARGDVGLWVVQFHGSPTDAGRDAVRSTGARLHGYLPHNAYVVRMTADQAAMVAAQKDTRFVGHYEPAWRLEPALRMELARGAVLPLRKYHCVVTDKRSDKPALGTKIRALGGRVVDPQEGSILFTVELDHAGLLAAARFDEVLWIDRWTAPEEDMNNARIQGGANYVETQGGYTGTGVRGHVYEGVEATHQDFTTPMTNVLSGGAPDAHGHSTAGIVFGNGTSNPLGRGMAPNARGFYTNYSSAQGSRNAVLGVVVNTHECMFTTASWGDARTRLYTSISADADDIIFDHRIPWTQSQSNAGNQDSRPQAWAKNIISIGGVAHFDNSNAADDSWAAGGGSTGPAADGRIKPDLCAYYDLILCSDLTGAAGYSANNWQTNFGGTSGATPICAGHNALAIQMYTDGIFGNPLPVPGGTRFQNRPLAQTLKALQIVNARQYAFTSASTNNRREHCGWGFPSLTDMYDNQGNSFIVAEDDILTQGITRTYQKTVAAGTPELKICMTYVDPAGNPASALAIKNDLTLKVTAPNGTIYWGNNGLTAGNWSTAGGVANTVDTVECVFVQSPAAGSWTIEVIATLIAEDAHIGTTVFDASYALCCVGVTGSGGIIRARFTPRGAGCAPQGTPSLPRTFYEVFGAFDLANSARRFTPNGSGGWNVSTSGASFFAGYSGNLLLGDDVISRNRPLGFAFPLPGGGTTTAIDVDSNGWIGLVANTHAGTDYTESVAEFLANPRRIAAFWDDLHPGNGGGVYFDAVPGMAVITWAGVPEYPATGSNTGQIQLYPNGEFVLAYGAASIVDCIVGHSVGGGVADPGPSDISNPGSGTPIAYGVSSLPRLGTTINLELSNLPAGSLAGFTLFGLVAQSVDLSVIGMQGCFLLVAPIDSIPMLVSGSGATAPFTIPNSASLLGAVLETQGGVVAPGANTLGVLTANAGTMVLGN
ncbi:MAG: S8 family serine peptidase [Planctomycetes bacterium]|nr:S8 family serine peptidase [Planctomycetota bacterium]